MPILCSMPAQRTPLRSPLPQPPRPSTGRNLGTTNRLMPRVPAGASGSFARTRWTMFSVRSCSPALMKILVPSTRKLPSSGRHGPGADQAEVGAALRLGQAHGARPGPVGEPGQEDRLQPLVGVPRQRIVGALAQAGIDGEGEVGAGEHLVEGEVDQPRQALATPLGCGGDAGPAAGAEGRVRRLEPARRAHDAVLVAAALLVAGAVERCQLALGQPRRLLEHAVDQLGRGVLAAGQRGDRLASQQLVQDEPHVAQRGTVAVHQLRNGLPVSSMCSIRAMLAGWRISRMNERRSSASRSSSASGWVMSASAPPESTSARAPATT